MMEYQCFGILLAFLLLLLTTPSQGLLTPKHQQQQQQQQLGRVVLNKQQMATESCRGGGGGGTLFRRGRNLPPVPSTTTVSAATVSNTAAADDDSAHAVEFKQYKDEATSLFGNVRIPAALFAGASAGAAFALPVSPTNNIGLKLGLVQRLYSLLMMSALSSEILAVVVSTLAVASLATRSCPATASVGALLQQEYELEWVAVRFHFLSGLITFIIGIGLRAWITIACPIIAKAALGIILSTAALCLAFIQDVEKSTSYMLEGVATLPCKYLKLLANKSIKKPLFAIAFTGMLLTSTYILSSITHIVHWLSQNQV